MASETLTRTIQTFELPGEAVFPESVGIDSASGDAYVGSLAAGALYRVRGGRDTVELWLAAGEDGRNSVAGVKVDPSGRLWAAGGYDGSLWVYQLSDRTLLARMHVGRQPSCVNDVAFGPDGAAYVTDSFIPSLFRISAQELKLEEWVDLAARGMPWPEGLNLNGIVLAPDQRHLVSCQTNTGRYWNIALDSGEVREVALDGGPLEHSDGLAIAGSKLYAAINARNRIAVMELADDGSEATVRSMLTSEAFAFPTAVAAYDGRLLVVNGQLDRMGGTPSLPFTVVAVEAKED